MRRPRRNAKTKPPAKADREASDAAALVAEALGGADDEPLPESVGEDAALERYALKSNFSKG